MINPLTLTPADISRKVIYRSDGQGLPESATIRTWTDRRIYIQVLGDLTITEARPMEVSFAAD